jgi:hypothetical protein
MPSGKPTLAVCAARWHALSQSGPKRGNEESQPSNVNRCVWPSRLLVAVWCRGSTSDVRSPASRPSNGAAGHANGQSEMRPRGKRYPGGSPLRSTAASARARVSESDAADGGHGHLGRAALASSAVSKRFPKGTTSVTPASVRITIEPSLPRLWITACSTLPATINQIRVPASQSRTFSANAFGD